MSVCFLQYSILPSAFFLAFFPVDSFLFGDCGVGISFSGIVGICTFNARNILGGVRRWRRTSSRRIFPNNCVGSRRNAINSNQIAVVRTPYKIEL